MLPLNIVEGLICAVIGVGVLTRARWLASLPVLLKTYRKRHSLWWPFDTRFVVWWLFENKFTEFTESDRGRRFAVVFWRICGTLWLLSGLNLVLDPSQTVRFPL